MMGKTANTSRRSTKTDPPPRGSEANRQKVTSAKHHPGHPADDRWLVFVSSALPKPRKRLIGYDRKAAVKAISILSDWCYAWTWEHQAFPGRFPPDELYVKEAEKAHMLILLIHDRLTPNTKKEYDASVLSDRSQMILFRDGFRLEKTTKAFQQSLRDTTYLKYRNASELKSILIKGLRSNLLRYASVGLDKSIGSNVDYGRLGV